MKILHIAECAGGVERYLTMLLPLLKIKGVDQCLICSEKYNRAKFLDMGVEVRQLNLKQSFSPILNLKVIVKLKRIFTIEKPDVVYCHSSFAGGLGRIAALGKGFKVVYNPHGWSFKMGGALSLNAISRLSLKQILYLMMEKVLAHLSDKIICISKAEHESALLYKVCKEEKLLVIENGIDIGSVKKAVAKGRNSMNFRENHYVVGMIGRMTDQKAPDVFIKAARIIKREIPNAVFIVVGNGELEHEVVSYAKKYDLQLYVTGWVDDPYSYLKEFDVALLLSRWEGFGLAIVEYMAAERNVVATRVDAIPSLVEDGVDGLLVNVDSDNEVAEKVIWLYKHPNEAQKMRENALKKVVENYDVRRVAEEHYKMFTNLF